MPCYHPLKGYRAKNTNENGKRQIVFNPKYGNIDLPVELPCGQCIGCKLERSRQWAVRCMHEASLHQDNLFITLTFDDDNLPSDNSINVRDFQLFMKRLRKKYPTNKIRFFHCGEYGEKMGRPHYHAILFNHRFPDFKLWKKTNTGENLFRSKSLEILWPYGYSSIGTVTFESAAYVARYIVKKITGVLAEQHYICPQTGVHRTPEYTTMSRRPGIASDWFDRFQGDVFPSDEISIRGKLMRPPKFYSDRYELTNPQEMASIRNKRKIKAKLNPLEKTNSRLLVKEKIHLIKSKQLIRELS